MIVRATFQAHQAGRQFGTNVVQRVADDIVTRCDIEPVTPGYILIRKFRRVFVDDPHRQVVVLLGIVQLDLLAFILSSSYSAGIHTYHAQYTNEQAL
jgi:hypothetical protein